MKRDLGAKKGTISGKHKREGAVSLKEPTVISFTVEERRKGEPVRFFEAPVI